MGTILRRSKTMFSIMLNLLTVEGGDAPGEHIVECTCELLMAIDYTLESVTVGKETLMQVIGCLTDLKQHKDKHNKAVYCKRVQFTVQDLFDARAAGWFKKVLKAVAKTLKGCMSRTLKLMHRSMRQTVQ